MRFPVPAFAFFAAAAFHAAFSASLESAEKEETVVKYDELTELRNIDQMEFDAAQKIEAPQMNVTEQQNEDTRHLEAAQSGSVEECAGAGDDITAEGGGNSEAAAHEESESKSSEEAEGRQRRGHHEAVTETASNLDEVSQDSTKEQDVLE